MATQDAKGTDPADRFDFSTLEDKVEEAACPPWGPRGGAKARRALGDLGSQNIQPLALAPPCPPKDSPEALALTPPTFSRTLPQRGEAGWAILRSLSVFPKSEGKPGRSVSRSRPAGQADQADQARMLPFSSLFVS